MQSAFSKAVTTALTTGALAFGSQAALSQSEATQAQPQQQQSQQQAGQAQVDDATIENFVAAYTDVRQVHTEYAKKLQQAENQEKAAELQQEAQQKMEQAVTENDISVQQYQRIAQQVGQDPQLRSRIQEQLQAERDS